MREADEASLQPVAGTCITQTSEIIEADTGSCCDKPLFTQQGVRRERKSENIAGDY